MSDIPNPPGNTQGLMQGMPTGQYIRSTFRSLLPSLIISIACPLLLYNLLSPHYPSTSILPLAVASCFPLLGNVISLIRTRHLDIFGILTFIGFAVSIIGVLLGGSPKLLLIRESFVTGAVGLACLVTLPFPKPLGYYFTRQFMTGNDPQKVAWFMQRSQTPGFHRAVRVLTALWGFLLLGEFILRTVMVFTLPIPTVLVVAPIVFNFLTLGGVASSFMYGLRARRKHQKEQQAIVPEHT
jgi:hypothetical protein